MDIDPQSACCYFCVTEEERKERLRHLAAMRKESGSPCFRVSMDGRDVDEKIYHHVCLSHRTRYILFWNEIRRITYEPLTGS